jgi:hypothetical protein
MPLYQALFCPLSQFYPNNLGYDTVKMAGFWLKLTKIAYFTTQNYLFAK